MLAFKILAKISTRAHAAIHYADVTPLIHRERETRSKMKSKSTMRASVNERKSLTMKIVSVEDSIALWGYVVVSFANAGSNA